MTHNYLHIPLICFSLLYPSHVLSQGDPVKGEVIYATCAACHGQHGEGLQATNSPRLSGLRKSYLVSQLQKFRSGLRGTIPEDVYGTQMASMAKILPDEQSLLDVVAYIGTLQSSRPTRTEISGDPVLGKKSYRYCGNCHGQDGMGYEAPEVVTTRSVRGPRLSGQHDWYLILQIQNFRARIRGNSEDKGTTYMQNGVQSLFNDQLIKDVVAYIGTLK
jgi:cytochrome c oxidase subunit 2